MKEFLEKNKVTYNLMSFTAFKSLLLFSYLLQSPRSYKEIAEFFKNHPYLNETISLDTLRVYLYSLERLGCEITKTKKPNGIEYKLVKHPFRLVLTNEQVESVIKVFKMLMKSIDVEELLSLTKFFDKISSGIENEDLKEKLVNISPLKKINPEILQTLIKACRKKEEITFNYKSPHSGIKNISLVTDKLSILNNKLYLYGRSTQYNDTASFLAERIVDKPVIQLHKTHLAKEEPTIITCEIYDFDIELNKNEKIISKDNEKMTIEILSDNIFLTRQRVLSFGSCCKVLAPESFRNDIISTLKKMREEYIAEEI